MKNGSKVGNIEEDMSSELRTHSRDRCRYFHQNYQNGEEDDPNSLSCCCCFRYYSIVAAAAAAVVLVAAVVSVGGGNHSSSSYFEATFLIANKRLFNGRGAATNHKSCSMLAFTQEATYSWSLMTRIPLSSSYLSTFPSL